MLRRRHLQIWIALMVAGASLAPAAHANGRPPQTNGVFFRPGDNQSLYVRSTFGLLVSRDGGSSFHWTCEMNIGYGGTYDPIYAIAADGTLFATTLHGLRVSRDGGCSFTTVTLPLTDPGPTADIWVDALDIGPTGEVWVATSENGKINNVYRSTDGGVTFAARGQASSLIFWKSVAVAPSNAMYVYLAGHQLTDPAPAAYLRTTTDGGASWNESRLTGVQFAGTPFITIAAIDPVKAQHVFLLSSGANGLGDRLYRSLDGGMTFTEVLATGEPITNVIIPDPATVLAVSAEGTFRSIDAGATFGPATSAPHLGCLGKRPDGTLIGCAANWDPDFMAVGRSADATQWQKIFRFVDLAGPLSCPAGTAGHDICDQEQWCDLRAQFGASGSPTCSRADDTPVDPPRSGGCCDAGARSPLGAGVLALLVAWTLRRRGRR